MKHLKIRHLTRYNYSEPVQIAPHKLLLRPRGGHDIRIESANLTISPASSVKWHRDLYGNSVAIVSFFEKANELEAATLGLAVLEAGPKY